MKATKRNGPFVIRGGEPYRSLQGTIYAPGVSAETAGARNLFVGLVTLPPGERTQAHLHERHESAFYVLSGDSVELWTGENLEHHEVARAGDYLYVPANLPHVAVNRGPIPAVFVGARTDATAQESVVLRPDLDPRVP